MTILPRQPQLGAALYAELCTALKTAREWNASATEIEVLRKAIQNRESVDVLSYEERELISRIVADYGRRSRPEASRRKPSTAKAPAHAAKDLGHLSFLADAPPEAQASKPNSN